MITSAFLNIFFATISYLIGLLPSISTSSSFVSAISTGSSYISGVYAFMPLITTSVLAIIAFDIIFESGYLLFKVIYWVIRRFPTQS